MKALLLLAFASTSMLIACGQNNEDKSKRPSPPAQAKETLASGAVVTINYSQPSVKGRKIGTDLEPKAGQVWRTGANEATTFEVSQDVKVQGQPLKAGKYGFFTIAGEGEWTLIFNKTWDQWGAYEYKAADDVLRVKAKSTKADPFAEKMTITVGKDGNATLAWGDTKVNFKID